ncbi:MAG: hypothetical protein ACKPBU_16245, partial [Alphaproteobacteria bacterium]
MTDATRELDEPEAAGAWTGGRLDGVVLTVAFVASRVFADRVLGLHFDPSALVWCVQFLDPVLLRDDLARSLWWLHAQPPLFNLFLGLGMKAFSETGPGFGLLFRAASLALVLALHALLRRLGVRRGWALGACLLFLASPALFYCECWLYYTLFEALLLVLTCIGFARLVARPTTGRFAEFLAWPTLLCLLRSTFQPAWLAAMALVPLVTLPGLRRARTAWAVFFLLLLPPLAWCAKNAAVFGFFGTSSWAGMHLLRVAGADVTLDEKRELVREGAVSPLVLTRPFGELPEYPREWTDVPARGHAAVDSPTKLFGMNNYNHASYVGIARQLRHDSGALARRRPDALLAAWRRGWALFFEPTETYPLFAAWKVPGMESWRRLFDLVVLWTLPAGLGGTSLLFLLAFAVALPACSLASARRLARGTGRPQDPAILFAAANLLYVAIVSNAADLGENQRFKFTIEPLLWAFLALGGQGLRARLAGAGTVG